MNCVAHSIWVLLEVAVSIVCSRSLFRNLTFCCREFSVSFRTRISGTEHYLLYIPTPFRYTIRLSRLREEVVQHLYAVTLYLECSACLGEGPDLVQLCWRGYREGLRAVGAIIDVKCIRISEVHLEKTDIGIISFEEYHVQQLSASCCTICFDLKGIGLQIVVNKLVALYNSCPA